MLAAVNNNAISYLPESIIIYFEPSSKYAKSCVEPEVKNEGISALRWEKAMMIVFSSNDTGYDTVGTYRKFFLLDF